MQEDSTITIKINNNDDTIQEIICKSLRERWWEQIDQSKLRTFNRKFDVTFWEKTIGNTRYGIDTFSDLSYVDLAHNNLVSQRTKMRMPILDYNDCILLCGNRKQYSIRGNLWCFFLMENNALIDDSKIISFNHLGMEIIVKDSVAGQNG